MGRIVVGVDGSEASVSALRWAMRAAEMHHAAEQHPWEVLVVHAWQVPMPAMMMAEGLLPPPNIDFKHEAGEVVARLLKEATDGAEPSVPVRVETPNAPAAKALLDAAASADLLVVGSRGHGGFSGLLLGSVSQQCAHHATCPVVIVHPRDTA
jgi:nucleotide-binding universal stress UspA family protein